MSKIDYPTTLKVEQVDRYHGEPVADPYRWLEDVDSPQTLAWIEAQNILTHSFLDGISTRQKIHQRLSELWNYPKAKTPVKRGGRYFQLRNTGLQNQDILVVFDSSDSLPRELLDPNTLSENGTIALTNWSVSDDGRWLAYATSASGSDWMSWRVRDVQNGQDLPDRIEWSKFSDAAWQPDGSGFFYARYDAPQPGEEFSGQNFQQKLYLHNLGNNQSQDKLIYARPDHKEWGFSPQVSEDGRYLILEVWQGTDTRNRLFYKDLILDGVIIELIPNLEASYRFIGNEGTNFFLRTDLNAPRARLVAVDIRQPEKEKWITLIPENTDVLEGVKLVGNQFIALYLHHAHHQIRLYQKDGNLSGDIALPTLGSIFQVNDIGISGSQKDDEIFYTFQSFVHPPTVFRYDLNANLAQIIFKPEIEFDPTVYETQQIYATSRDGTRIPMFIVHHKELKYTGQLPTLLYGYGGFNISELPEFLLNRLIWLELGGVFALANLRGGGEYGEDWHQAGTIHHKQNVFDDFIACAEHLISSGITNNKKLAIQGRSNGGLLVGACMTQHPELFGACLPAVGVMDMLRFHKFTIGWAWVSDYGSAEDPEQFKTLLAYSPLHNITPGVCYPPTLVTTADHDDRVVPGHSFKFAAALQAAQNCEAPVLIRIQTKAGHGIGTPTSILINEQADILAFICKTLDAQF